MKIKYLAHACFLLTSKDGVRIITDPYTPAPELTYGEIAEPADIVTVSHGHGDHSNAAAVRGNPVVIQTPDPVTVKGVQVRGVPAFHDEQQGKQRGKDILFVLNVDDLTIAHLGDLGHVPDARQLSHLGPVDILLLPVGGYYTIDAAVAGEVARKINPRVIIPMHFKTPKCAYPIGGVEAFLEGKANVTRVNGSETEFSRAKLPGGGQIVYLQPALL